jgi:hypothetical protein
MVVRRRSSLASNTISLSRPHISIRAAVNKVAESEAAKAQQRPSFAEETRWSMQGLAI